MVLDLMCEDLVRGRIDSISRTLQMAWIKPIVGGNSELTRLRSGIEKWAIKSTIK
ncbi:hypothetical protein MHBO_003339 [Bonamia ostreae]|uniref:Uncharacterized protein n=1 Tax=Bonamia ostreae TaxID=126728 RepID=A0ABV2AQ63_9EUKA